MLKKAGFVAFILVLLPPLGMSWGYQGHEITALIAQKYLSENAKSAIAAILDGREIAEIASWADDIKKDHAWDHAKPWHYTNFEDNETYRPPGPEDKPDIYSKLVDFEKVLRDPNASKQEKELALKWFVHLVGDLHQPLHAGRGSDRGGNGSYVSWFGETHTPQGREINLHSVWDYSFIERRDLEAGPYADQLFSTIEAEQLSLWRTETDYLTWIKEDRALRDGIYDYQDKQLGQAYYQTHLPTVEMRLQAGGVRLAALLNDIFE